MSKIANAQLQEKQDICDKLVLSYLQKCDIYKELRELILEHKDSINNTPLISNIQFERLQKEINYSCADFTIRLQESFPKLKPEDVDFCCLIRSGFKYAEIACLLGRTPNMMYKRRKAIVEYIRTTGIHLDTLETFINSF